MPTENKLEQRIREVADAFVHELIEALRGMTLDELTELSAMKAPAKRRGRPRKAAAPVAEPETAAAPAAAAAPPEKPAAVAKVAPTTKPKKKRAWPKCSVEGCDKNVYMPSGANKLCYQHHLEKGGKPTPLAKVNQAKKAKAAARKKAAAKDPAAKKAEAPAK